MIRFNTTALAHQLSDAIRRETLADRKAQLAEHERKFRETDVQADLFAQRLAAARASLAVMDEPACAERLAELDEYERLLAVSRERAHADLAATRAQIHFIEGAS